MKRLKRSLGIAVSGALLLSMTMVGTAGAHHGAVPDPVTACGSLVTSSLTLTHNIGPCSGHGLIVPASATTPLTINLAGFSITGDGAGADLNAHPSGDAGILIQKGGVTVTSSNGKGTVQLFNAGVAIDGVSNNKVEKLLVQRNQVVGLNGTNVTDYGEGIQLLNSSNNVIRANDIKLNTGWSGMTVLGNSDNNKIGNDGVASNDPDGNHFENNDQPEGGFAKQTSGLRVENLGTACPNDNVIDGNKMELNGNDGIQLFNCSTGNVIVKNKVETNGRNGIHLFPGANNNFIGVHADGTTAGPNELKGNGTRTQSSGDGISVGGSNNQVKNNLVKENLDDGIVIGFCRQNLPSDPPRCFAGGDDNDVSNNTVAKNGTAATATDPAHGSGIKAQKDNLSVVNGAEDNDISNNTVSLNVVIDLRDEWNDCTHNDWSGHGTTATRNPSCIG